MIAHLLSTKCCTISKSSHAERRDSNKVPPTNWGRFSNLYSNGFIQWSDKDTTYIPESYLEEYPDFVIQGGEIVMNLTAQSLEDGFLGRVCVSKDDEYCLLNQRLARITAKQGIRNDYLFWALQSRLAREYLHRMPVGTKVKHLYNFEIENIPLLIPDDETVQMKIAEVMRQYTGIKSQLELKKHNLENISFIDSELSGNAIGA